MPSFCVVSNCEHKYTHSDNVSFHKFPHHSKKLLEKWIKFTERDFTWKPSRWSAICSRHFLTSDFRNTVSGRKCLKREAIPSITVKNYEGNLFHLQNNEHTSLKAVGEIYMTDSNCRLCGLCCKVVTSFSSNFEVYTMIQKCFPSLNIQRNDTLPKDICSACLQRLQAFSGFFDSVLNTQRKIEESLYTKNSSITVEKSLKIKQEPNIKIKQETSEGLQDILPDDIEFSLDEEQTIDQKTKVSTFPFKNSDEIIKNCDIIEIINLDDAFIDIPDDEGGGEEATLEPEQEAKEYRQQSMIYPRDEHNYSKVIHKFEFEIKVSGYKTEKFEEIDTTHLELMKPYKDIIIINESIVKPVPAYDLYQCNHCSMQFLTEGILSQHKNLSHAEKQKLCTNCNIKFKTFYNFMRHKNMCHKKIVHNKKRFKIQMCHKCKKACSSKLTLKNHKKYLCKYQQKSAFVCKFCNKKEIFWITLKKHELNCKKLLKNKNAKKTHPKQRQPDGNGKFSCKICSRTYRSRRNVLLHESCHRPIEQWNYKCGDCGKLFDFCNDLRYHLKNKECKAAPKGADHVYFVCTICDAQFKSLTKLKWHNLIHTGVKPFPCETCGKAFRSFNNLYQHKITHTTIRRHKCNMCEKTFKRRGGLNQHKKGFHLRLKPHECPICLHKYALKGDMVRCKHSSLRERSFETT